MTNPLKSVCGELNKHIAFSQVSLVNKWISCVKCCLIMCRRRALARWKSQSLVYNHVSITQRRHQDTAPLSVRQVGQFCCPDSERSRVWTGCGGGTHRNWIKTEWTELDWITTESRLNHDWITTKSVRFPQIIEHFRSIFRHEIKTDCRSIFR